jgi:hypothetical protein
MTRRRPTFDDFHVRKRLMRAAEREGGLEAFARTHKLDELYVIEAAKGRTLFSAKLLNALGLERVTRFVPRRAGA